MWRFGRAALLGMATLLLSIPAVIASSAGPPPARTGGFGEMTCRECHWDSPVNEPPGLLALSGVPERYTPGEAYTITVRVSHPEARRAGFELAARFEGAANAGSAAGTLGPLDDRTDVVMENGVSYTRQTDAGSRSLTGAVAEWKVQWTAPSDPSVVVFHVAANAANGDASPLGDYIYTAVVRASPAAP
jgi:hypothetical protein